MKTKILEKICGTLIVASLTAMVAGGVLSVSKEYLNLRKEAESGPSNIAYALSLACLGGAYLAKRKVWDRQEEIDYQI